MKEIIFNEDYSRHHYKHCHVGICRKFDKYMETISPIGAMIYLGGKASIAVMLNVAGDIDLNFRDDILKTKKFRAATLFFSSLISALNIANLRRTSIAFNLAHLIGDKEFETLDRSFNRELKLTRLNNAFERVLLSNMILESALVMCTVFTDAVDYGNPQFILQLAPSILFGASAALESSRYLQCLERSIAIASLSIVKKENDQKRRNVFSEIYQCKSSNFSNSNVFMSTSAVLVFATCVGLHVGNYMFTSLCNNENTNRFNDTYLYNSNSTDSNDLEPLHCLLGSIVNFNSMISGSMTSIEFSFSVMMWTYFYFCDVIPFAIGTALSFRRIGKILDKNDIDRNDIRVKRVKKVWLKSIFAFQNARFILVNIPFCLLLYSSDVAAKTIFGSGLLLSNYVFDFLTNRKAVFNSAIELVKESDPNFLDNDDISENDAVVDTFEDDCKTMLLMETDLEEDCGEVVEELIPSLNEESRIELRNKLF